MKGENDLHLPVHSTLRLNELRVGQQAVVQHVEDDDPELLRYFQSIGLVPQARLEVLGYSSFDDNIQLLVNDQLLVLGPRVTRQVFVDTV